MTTGVKNKAILVATIKVMVVIKGKIIQAALVANNEGILITLIIGD